MEAHYNNIYNTGRDATVFHIPRFLSSLPAGPVRVREDVNDDDDDEEERVKVSGCGGTSSGLRQLYPPPL